MNEDQIRLLEEYINSESKAEVVARMHPLSWQHRYFSALHHLASGNLSEFDSSVKSLSELDSSKASTLQLRKLLSDLESTPSSVIEEISKKYISRPSFDFSPPQIARSADEISYPSSLDQSIFNIDWEEIYTKLNSYRTISTTEHASLDVRKMTTEIFKQFLSSPYISVVPGATERLAELIASKNFHEVEVFESLTLDQIMSLESLYPDVIGYQKFVNCKIKKQYLAGTESYSPKEMYQVFQIMWTELKEYPESLNYCKLSVLNCLLAYGVGLGHMSEEYFNEYVRTYIFETKSKSRSKSVNLFTGYPSLNPEEIMRFYMPEVLKTEEDVREYSQYMDAEKLMKEFAKNQILKGFPVEEYKHVLDSKEIENLGKSIELEPCKDNQTTYSQSEAVTIKMKVKNANKVLVRVLEINTRAYYAKNMTRIQTDINLDGLVAKEEKVYEYSESSFVRAIRSFEFPSLTGKSGLFVIEFIGNGRYSRAMITKGILKYVSKVTIAGHMISVLDENNKVCSGEYAGVTVDGRFYSTREGYAIIPFTPHPGSKTIILTDGNIAELAEGFMHTHENYELKTAFLIHSEQFLIGNRASLSMKPVLYLNGIKAHESLISDLSLVVQTRDVEGISTSKTFNRLSLPTGTDVLTVEIEVPPRLRSLELLLSGTVKYASTQRTETLTSSYHKSLNDNLETYRVFNAQLKAQSDQFYIEVRGRNGEPLKNVQAELSISTVNRKNPVKSGILSSDANGIILLGSLKGVIALDGSIYRYNERIPVSWNIDVFENYSSYPKTIYLCEGDEFGIPISLPEEDPFNPYNLTFKFFKSNSLIKLATDKLEYSDHMLRFKDLEKGRYELAVPRKATISIEVMDGHHWGTDYILTEHKAISTPNQYKNIAIADTITEADSLVVKLSGDIEDTVVHAIHATYHTDDIASIIEGFSGLFLTSHTEIGFKKPFSFYLDSIYLDEEYRYVLDRRNQPRMMGNTLPKPQVLLKRFFLKETETVTQTADQGGRLQNLMASQACSMAKMHSPSRKLHGGLSKKANDNLDFLECPAFSTVLVEVDSNGIAKIPIDKSHSQVILIASNKECFCSKIVATDSQSPLRELRLKESMDESLSFSEQKKSEGLNTGDSFVIKDVSSTQVEVIDSLDKLFTALSAVCKVNMTRGDYKKWNFLGEWGLLELSKKLELFDSFISHELNLFLYMKDPEFFETFVKPHLSCKMEKDVIDKFLLDEDLTEYTEITAFKNLNYLEKCLVIQKMRTVNREFSDRAAKMIVEEAAVIRKNEEHRSKQYDSILGSRSMDKQPQMRGPPMPQSAPQVGNSQGFGGMGGFGFFGMQANSAHHELDMLENFSIKPCSSALPHMATDLLLDMRQEQPVYYEKLGAANEYVETFYYAIRPPQSVQIAPSKFWAELAENFSVLSDSFVDQTSNLTEFVSVLAFSPLQFSPPRHEYTVNGTSATLTASSPALVVYKELSKVPSNVKNEILVAQRYIDPQDQYIVDEFGQREKTVSQFIKDHIYLCQVIVTNTSDVHMKLSVLVEIPQGSIPLTPYKYSDTLLLEVSSFHTLRHSYSFYFPQSGTFTHFPPNVSLRGVVISKANPNTIHVQDKLEVSEYSSFRDLVIGGEKDRILEFIRNENLYSQENQFDWNLIYFMMKDKNFWQSTINILREKQCFQEIVWAFSIYHSDPEAFAEYLKSISRFKEKLGYFYTSKYIQTGKLNFSHREFDPLVNARAYRLADKERITNKRLLEVYKDFLFYLSEKPHLEDEDYICWAQHMILQERLEEAHFYYSKVQMDFSKDSYSLQKLQVQYDYLSCYLDLEKAKVIAPLYAEYPIETWKKYFKEVLELIKELSEEYYLPQKVQEKEPSLDFEVVSDTICIHYSFVESCKVRLYLIDLEVLFSKKPFFIEGTQDFSFVTANVEIQVDLDNSGKHEITIPEELRNKNFVVEVDYKIYVVSKPFFANSLKLNIVERYGAIKVMDSELQPRPKAYVKAFAKKKNGNVEFYKDGYTDIRGKFDYVSLNVDILSEISELALLVVDDELGSQVTTAKPPPQ